MKRGNLSVENVEGTPHGRVRWSGLEIKEKCSIFECVYAGEVSNGMTLKGGSGAKLIMERAKMPVKSGSCIGPLWTGEYEISSPTPLYVTGKSIESLSGQGTLCAFKEFFPCTGPWKYGIGTTISAKLKAATTSIIEAGFATIQCEASTIDSEVVLPGSPTEPIVGILSSLTFGECNCKVQVLAPGTFVISWTTGNNGNLTLKGYEIAVDCGGKECTFAGKTGEGITLEGGNPAAIKAKEAPVPKKSGLAECTSTSKWTAEYEVTNPTSLYVFKE